MRDYAREKANWINRAVHTNVLGMHSSQLVYPTICSRSLIGANMLDTYRPGESLNSWAERNGITLNISDDFPDPSTIGYWCRISGVPISDECLRRGYDEANSNQVLSGWTDADEELKYEQVGAS